MSCAKQCRGGRHRQLVREPSPDQAQPRDRIIGALDLGRILIRDHDPEIAHILGRLAQRGGVDAREHQPGAVAEKLRGHRGAFGLGDEFRQPVLDQRNTLVQRQRLQLGCGQPKSVEGINGRAGPRRGLAQPPRQLQRRQFDLAHGDARQIARAL